MERNLKANLAAIFADSHARAAANGAVYANTLGDLRSRIVRALTHERYPGYPAQNDLGACVKALRENHQQCRLGKLSNGNGLLHLLGQRDDFFKLSPSEFEAAIIEFRPILEQLRHQVDWRNMAERVPLHIACFYGNRLLAASLVSFGADIHARDTSGDRPLHDAASHGSPDIASLLLSAGADSRALNRKSQTPLQVALAKNKPEAASVLLSFQERAEISAEIGPDPLSKPAPARRI